MQEIFGILFVSGIININLNAIGIIAIGGYNAVGIISFGGINSAGVISIGGINAIGIFSFSGVNSIGGFSISGANCLAVAGRCLRKNGFKNLKNLIYNTRE
jgi:hypothetical protein